MSRTQISFLPAAVLIVAVSSGCYSHRYRVGPPPPAYACDSYGCDGYDAFGGYSQCVDGGQYYSRRDQRRMRRDVRRFGQPGRGWNGETFNGMPVMAAYIVPIGMDGGFGCGCMSCGTCDPYGGCGDCCGGMPCDMGGCLMDGGYQTYQSEQPAPSSVPPSSGTGTEEGNWERVPQAPQSFVEPAASRPLERSWLPAAL